MSAIRFCGCHGARTGDARAAATTVQPSRALFPVLLFVHILQALDADYAYRYEAFVSGNPSTTKFVCSSFKSGRAPFNQPKD